MLKKSKYKDFHIHFFLVSILIFVSLTFISSSCFIPMSGENLPDLTYYPKCCILKDGPTEEDVMGCINSSFVGESNTKCDDYFKVGGVGNIPDGGVPGLVGVEWESNSCDNLPKCNAYNCVGIYINLSKSPLPIFLTNGAYDCGPIDSSDYNNLYQCDDGVFKKIADCTVAGGICNKDTYNCDLFSQEEPTDSRILVWKEKLVNTIKMINLTGGTITSVLVPDENKAEALVGNVSYLKGIYNGNIVYTKTMTDKRDINNPSKTEIFLYSLAGNKQVQITNNSLGYGLVAPTDSDPDIYKNLIVWSSNKDKLCTTTPLTGCYSDVWMCDLTPGSSNECRINHRRINYTVYNKLILPKIYGNKIVFMNTTNTVSGDVSNYDISVYDLATNESYSFVVHNYAKTLGDIYENTVVWSDARNGNNDIYIYDLETGQEIQITNNIASQVNPRIYKNYIVWEDYRAASNNPDIWMCDLTSESVNECGSVDGINDKQITSTTAQQTKPYIFGSKITWSDSSGGIWLYDLGAGTSVKKSTASSDLSVLA